MSERKPIPNLKNAPYVGLFQYPLLSTLLRRNHPIRHLLPPHNPHIGTFNHAINHSTKRSGINVIFKQKKDATTQTDPVHSMIIGDKIIEAYGEDYKILINT